MERRLDLDDMLDHLAAQPATHDDEWVTARQAAAALAATAAIGLRQARAVLDLGLAGQPQVQPRLLLYSSRRAQDLLERPVLDLTAPSEDWAGVLVLRRPVPSTLPWRDRADALSPGWDISGPSLLRMRFAHQAGPVLVLGTVSAFVGTVAVLRGAHARWRERGTADLDLVPAPPALAWVAGTRLPSRRGSAWSWHEPPRTQPSTSDRTSS